MTAVAQRLAITEPGVYPDVPHGDYIADPVPGGSLSSSGAKRLLPPSCPALYRWYADHPEASTKTFDVGTAAHQLVLGVGPEIICVEAKDWRTNAAKEKRDRAYAIGAVPLLPPVYEQVEAMAEALRAHPVAAALLDPSTGRPEQTLIWRDADTAVMRRARLDWLPATQPGRRLLVGDYKTTACAEPGKFERSAFKDGYFGQAAWYLDAVRALGLGDDDAQFVWVAQEKDPPYLVSITYADPIALRWAADRNRQALEVYAECQATGQWPGYGDDPTPLALPTWVERRYLEDYR